MLPRTLMIVGDGFSRSFLQAIDIPTRVDTSVLMPLALPVPLYDPVSGQVRYQNCWSQEAFPILMTEWSNWIGRQRSPRTDSDYHSFLRYAATNFRVNQTDERHIFSYNTSSLSYQLASYYWNIFCSIDRSIEMHLTQRDHNFSNWPWLRILSLMTTHSILSCISFNYDCTLEKSLSFVGCKTWSTMHGCRHVLNQAKPRHVPILKPHGSITFNHAPIFGFGNSEPWKANFTLDGIGIEYPVTPSEYPPKEFPSLPEIVPPGHAGLHRVLNSTDIVAGCRQAASQAKIIVLCGLSALEPDTQEFRDMFTNVSKRPLVFHVGLERDRLGPAAGILRQVGRSNYNFVDATSLWSECDRVLATIMSTLVR